MTYALLTDNSVQWFSFLVAISETGEAVEHYSIPNSMSNKYLSNLFNRGMHYSDLPLTIPGISVDRFYGNNCSEYEFGRVRKMIELYPQVQEYERLGRLE